MKKACWSTPRDTQAPNTGTGTTSSLGGRPAEWTGSPTGDFSAPSFFSRCLKHAFWRKRTGCRFSKSVVTLLVNGRGAGVGLVLSGIGRGRSMRLLVVKLLILNTLNWCVLLVASFYFDGLNGLGSMYRASTYSYTLLTI